MGRPWTEKRHDKFKKWLSDSITWMVNRKECPPRIWEDARDALDEIERLQAQLKQQEEDSLELPPDPTQPERVQVPWPTITEQGIPIKSKEAWEEWRSRAWEDHELRKQ